MRHLRFVTLALAVLAAAGATFAGAAATRSATPTNLRAFLLRPDETGTHVFSRTPAFAWSPVRGARCYEFELATSKAFSQSSLIWSNVQYTVGRHSVCASVPASAPAAPAPTSTTKTTTTTTAAPAASTPSDPAVQSVIPALRVPAVSIDVALPWFTGVPYALYAHVRAITATGATNWSSAFGFNMQWPDIARPIQSKPGLIRWSQVAGATSYQVWYTDVSKVFSTHTNVADEREFYIFHPDASWTATVHWRVRAVRRVFGDIPNGLPAVSFGPWSPVYTASNPPQDTGPLVLREAISDHLSTAKKVARHELQPAMTFTGTSVGGRAYALFRVYVSTDRDCVNVVYRGPVVGSPAYAPRTTGPLKLPADDAAFQLAQTSFLPDTTGSEGPTLGADGFAITTTEAGAADSGGAGSAAAASGSAGTSDVSQLVAGAKVDLPDLNFPTTRYWWTVVPIVILIDPNTSAWKYVDAQVPQDACQSGRVMSFGKESEPVVTAGRTPYIAGLTPKGRLLAVAGKRPVVYGTPLVAWQPTVAAAEYEVQWAKHPYPFNARGSKFTYSTSTLLSLKPGVWFYRVRGLNLGQLRNPYMSWSTPVRVKVAAPKFAVVGGNGQVKIKSTGVSSSSASSPGANSFFLQLAPGWTRTSGGSFYAQYVRDNIREASLSVIHAGGYSSDPRAFLGQAKSELSVFHLKSIALVNLPGGRAVRAVFDLGSNKVQELQYSFLPMSGKTWILTFGATGSSYEARLADFESMARSFRGS